jgi:hypothetical protein
MTRNIGTASTHEAFELRNAKHYHESKKAEELNDS